MPTVPPWPASPIDPECRQRGMYSPKGIVVFVNRSWEPPLHRQRHSELYRGAIIRTGLHPAQGRTGWRYSLI